MRQTISRIVLILLVVGGLAFAGVTIYGNFIAPKSGEIKVPRVEEAHYSLTVLDTRTVIFADKVEVIGDTVGSRMFICRGYWELQGRNFARNDSTLVMSESVFGELTLKKRS